MLSREELIASIRAALEPLPQVASLFEAGSAAFGRADEFSDIDLTADVEDGTEDEVFAVLEDALSALVQAHNPRCSQAILVRKIIPQPAFHGMAQRFYRLAETDEWLILDISLRPLSKPGHFGEVERHGQPVIIFDKTGAAQPTALNQAEWQVRLVARVAELRENHALFGNFAEKEERRGRAIDAFAMYHGMVLRPLVELLRIKHHPARHDFGLRYLEFDLPPEVHARLVAFYYPASLAELADRQARARVWFEQLLTELESTTDETDAIVGQP